MQPISRRSFLELSGFSLAALFLPWSAPDPTEKLPPPRMRARITIPAINIYQEPDFKSPKAGRLKRNYLVDILDEVNSPKGPSYNPRWYRLEQGYIHSAYTQRIDGVHLNAPLKSIPAGGQLGEISIPYVQSQRKLRNGSWQPLWWLYYQSVHWITQLEEGPDGQAWYGLTDELLHVQYYLPASHVRPIQPEELTPLSPQVPEKEKRLEVSIAEQSLIAYEGSQIIRQAKISSGLHTENLPPDVLPTDTPSGYFHIQVKVPSKHMGDGRLTSDVEAYELLGVPWVCFFHKEGIAFHGTYWHDNFGRKMSHGCVNLKNEDAKWLYRWSLPAASASDWNVKGWGTPLRIA